MRSMLTEPEEPQLKARTPNTGITRQHNPTRSHAGADQVSHMLNGLKWKIPMNQR
jgi:hypothetical protein